MIHIPVGELLVREIEKDSDLGKIIAGYIKSAVIVPPDITFNAFMNAVSKYEKENNLTILVDGYPRNYDNYRYLMNKMPNNMKISKIIYLKCNEDVMIERITKRKQSNPDRIDNDIDIIKKRIKTFYEQTIPIIEEFEKENKVITIDSNNTIDNIIEKIS